MDRFTCKTAAEAEAVAGLDAFMATNGGVWDFDATAELGRCLAAVFNYADWRRGVEFLGDRFVGMDDPDFDGMVKGFHDALDAEALEHRRFTIERQQAARAERHANARRRDELLKLGRRIAVDFVNHEDYRHGERLVEDTVTQKFPDASDDEPWVAVEAYREAHREYRLTQAKVS